MERFDSLKWKCVLLVTEKKTNLSVPMALMKEVKIVIPKLDIVSPVCCYVLQPAENDTFKKLNKCEVCEHRCILYKLLFKCRRRCSIPSTFPSCHL